MNADTTNTVDNGVIDFYFDFISPYGWLGAEKVGALARKFGRRVNWHPFLLKVTVLETMGMKPPLETPLKGDYLLHDIKRSLRYHGLFLHEKSKFGFLSVVPARAVMWAHTTAPEKIEDLVLALYRAHWRDGKDISDTATVLDVIESISLARHEAAIALKSASIKVALRDAVSDTISKGIFGSPSFIIDGEMFWGSDRLQMIKTWLEKGGW
ncbi:2-hydroxychromene-2-carboxylate isomerase [Kordiimonas pumila]|uniref:2-hydroxychromene-2-carboxylate isomerase n=1 Tax=Kordiimonas pumila TaxID=2161677 RepID=A0ABV7D978_9PROT|nr:2-hydroxychromene-2-carboxylate isomerase [Kordiimonas pumila]